MDIEKIRKDFGQKEDEIWFNSASTSYMPNTILQKVFDKVIKWQSSFENGYLGNIKSIDEEWKKSAVKMINCDEDEITGVLCTTQGLCVAIYGIGLKEGDNVVINELEYVSLPQTVFHQAKMRSCEVKIAKRDGWEIPQENIEALIDKNTRAIVLSHVEFVNGFRHNLKKIAEIAHKNSAFLIVDAIQSLGALKVDVKETDVDILTAGGHKWMSSLYGYGILYVKKDIIPKLENPFGSYAGIRDKKRASEDYSVGMDFVKYYEIDENSIEKFGFSTENLIGKVAFTEMMKYFIELGLDKVEKSILSLSGYFIDRLKDKGLEIRSSLKLEHRSGIINFMPYEGPAKFVEKMRENKIYLGQRGGGVRVSLHLYNTFDEIERLMKFL
jgi:selenocysteine lyase/cysteine desulfurase